jgi:hypothetical protein
MASKSNAHYTASPREIEGTSKRKKKEERENNNKRINIIGNSKYYV